MLAISGAVRFRRVGRPGARSKGITISERDLSRELLEISPIHKCALSVCGIHLISVLNSVMKYVASRARKTWEIERSETVCTGQRSVI